MVGHGYRERASSITPKCTRLFLILFSTTSMVAFSWRFTHSPPYLPCPPFPPFRPPSPPPSVPHSLPSSPE